MEVPTIAESEDEWRKQLGPTAFGVTRREEEDRGRREQLMLTLGVRGWKEANLPLEKG